VICWSLTDTENQGKIGYEHALLDFSVNGTLLCTILLCFFKTLSLKSAFNKLTGLRMLVFAGIVSWCIGTLWMLYIDVAGIITGNEDEEMHDVAFLFGGIVQVTMVVGLSGVFVHTVIEHKDTRPIVLKTAVACSLLVVSLGIRLFFGSRRTH
jgi:hypothetical protein